MTTIMCHPDSATLMSFAAGTLAEPLAAVVAAHVDMCEACRCEVADLDLVGALLLADVASPRGTGAPARAMLPDLTSVDTFGRARRHVDPSGRLPRPIAAAYQLSFEGIPWKRLGPGVWHHRLPLGPAAKGDLRLLKIGPGRVMPDHGHGGGELTLVLDGVYTDETGTFRRGDIQDVDETVEHTPVADRDTGCICLIASERPARFKGLVGRLIQPWTGM